MAFTLISSAFDDGQEIPPQYTCDGDNLSPPLAWSGLPAGTASLVLIVDDPDAPDPAAPKRTWVHWILYNLPPTVTGLPAGIAPEDLPPGTREGINDSKNTGYDGPCPPIGRHRYVHKLYALDTRLRDLGMPTKPVLEKAMKDHIIAMAQLIGAYQRTSSARRS